VNRSLTPLSPALYSHRPKPTLSPAGQNPFPHHRVNDAEAQPNPAPACDGPELCNRKSPAVASQLPAAPFESNGSAPGRPPAVVSGWSRHLATAFRSPARAARFQASIRGIIVPGVLLRCLAGLSSDPFGVRLLRSPRFAPVWARSLPQTRYPTAVQQFPAFPRIPAPRKGFRALADQCATRFRPGGSPTDASGFPSLPAAEFYI